MITANCQGCCRRLAASLLMLLLVCLSPAGRCWAQDTDTLGVDIDVQGLLTASATYVTVSELPNAVNYLPAPPDSTDALFTTDFVQWQWGKSLRGTTRGNQASRESQYGLNRWAIILSALLKVSMSSTRTPKILKLIYHVGETASRSTQLAKLTYQRRRPFEVMGEHPWGQYDREEELRGNGSFPSAHSAYGWGVALVMAEMFPHLQDTILRRAFEYGEGRVIVGAHWQSDVEAARLTAATAVARMHREPVFMSEFEEARNEYYTVLGITPPDIADTGLPLGARILNHPVDSASNCYLADVAQYWQAKSERGTLRGDQAAADALCTSTDDLLETFATATGNVFTEELTPALYDVVRLSRDSLLKAAQQLRDTWPVRKRPWQQVGEPRMVPDTDSIHSAASAYPSFQGTVGWGVALLMADIMADKQDVILKRGYELGRSQEIMGDEYASDVLAGRTLACAVVARLHAQPEFAQAIIRARYEYEVDPLYTPVGEVRARSIDEPNQWFTIDGKRLPAEPAEPGIYSHGGTKVVR